MDLNNSMQTQPDTFHPLTLESGGRPPETRIGSANQARSIFQRMQETDLQVRSKRRALVKGLVDGNPPYRQRDLDNAGRSHQCNINFRMAESYLENAVGAFYDAHNEAPTYATIRLKKGTPEEVESWSRIVTLHFDWLCRFEESFDYTMQVSQAEMVLYGRGPLVFQDIFDWRPIALRDDQLKVPEGTKSDTSLWEYCSVEMEYLADQLWKFIRNEKEAKQLGWNVERVKQAIIRASPEANKGGLYMTWEWHQQQLKNGSIDYSSASKTISVAHVFCREFAKEGEAEGKITHVMVDQSPQGPAVDTFLFQKVGRFDNWRECIHPMYYDRGIGGFHHGVTGMGTKMFSLFELQNRLLCNASDKAMAPKLFFKPTSSSVAEEFSIVQHGDYGVSPEGFDVQQIPIGGFVDEAMLFNRQLTEIASSNLSAYRTNLSEPMRGNPDTATKVQLDASKEAALQKTQMVRYYTQKDALYAEMYRRAVNTVSKTSPGGARALEFIERCKTDGVPLEAMKQVEWVQASRVVGQGSQYLRKQVLNELWVTVGQTIPEDGRTNLVDDIIAVGAGPSGVERYNPKPSQATLPSDQYANAVSQVADMKIGVPAVVTASQNPAIYAAVFLKAGDDAAGSLERGANPQEVAAFLELDGQAIAKHLQRMSKDPSRKGLLQGMVKQMQQLAQIHDKLVQHIQQQAEQQQAEQQRLQQEQTSMQSQFALDKAKQDFELGLRAEKTRAGIADKNLKTQQSMILKDATTAQSIKLNRLQHEHDKRMSELQAEHERTMAIASNRNGE